MKRLFALLLALSTLPGCARAEMLVDLHVLDLEDDQFLVRHPHEGRQYIEGRPGHRYAVVLQNLTPRRVLAVLSVDGVNAITGQTAGTGQSGYVLEPWQRLEVRGWRKDLSSVAAFHFTALGDSYAARTGRPRNVGVIGVAAFRERELEEITVYGTRVEAQAKPGASADAAAPAMESRAPAAAVARQQLGTGHGERVRSDARRTRFERESDRPEQVMSLWYDATEALVARGVIPPRWDAPEAFPVGFTPDP
jgi:hypothetical protein